MSDDEQRSFQFGQIGVQQRLFSQKELAQAQRLARERGGSAGEVLVEQGRISRDQLAGLERAITFRLGRDQDKDVARILIESNYCGPEAVNRALARQKELYAQTGDLHRLADMLVEQNDLSASQRVAAHKIRELGRRLPAP